MWMKSLAGHTSHNSLKECLLCAMWHLKLDRLELAVVLSIEITAIKQWYDAVRFQFCFNWLKRGFWLQVALLCEAVIAACIAKTQAQGLMSAVRLQSLALRLHAVPISWQVQGLRMVSSALWGLCAAPGGQRGRGGGVGEAQG